MIIAILLPLFIHVTLVIMAVKNQSCSLWNTHKVGGVFGEKGLILYEPFFFFFPRQKLKGGDPLNPRTLITGC